MILIREVEEKTEVMPLERGSKKYTCPRCGTPKKFKRYIDDIGDYFSDEVGRCDRESSCGYHMTPQDYFDRHNVQPVNSKRREQKNTMNEMNAVNTLNVVNTLNAANIIDNSFLVRSLAFTPENRLLNYLLTFIDVELVEKAVQDYLIGTTKDGRTVFWQIDREGRARTGKIISYLAETGKRDKARFPSWIHYELKQHKLLPASFEHKICFFGEHLTAKHKKKPVAVVEAEKTALVASIFIPGFVWVAAGGKSYLKAEKLVRFGDRKIILYPDADGFEFWKNEADEARKLGLRVEVSELIEYAATAEEKQAGFDLADYLIRSELEAQELNALAADYNAKVETILNELDLLNQFFELCAEREAIQEIKPEELDLDTVRQLAETVFYSQVNTQNSGINL